MDRAVRELETRKLVTSLDGKYCLTPFGRLLLEYYTEFARAVKIAWEIEPILQWIPPEGFELDFRSLADAQITVPNETDPYAPVNRHVESLKAAEKTWALLPVIGQHALEIMHQRIVVEDEDLENELAVDPAVAETLQSDPVYAEKFEELATTDSVDFYVYNDSIPYYLGRVDDTIQIGVNDGQGLPRALVELENSEARDWAENIFAKHRKQAEPLTPEPSTV